MRRSVVVLLPQLLAVGPVSLARVHCPRSIVQYEMAAWGRRGETWRRSGGIWGLLRPLAAYRSITPDRLLGAMQADVHLLGFTLPANVGRSGGPGSLPVGVTGLQGWCGLLYRLEVRGGRRDAGSCLSLA